METTKESSPKLFQLTPTQQGRKVLGTVISKKRVLIGRAETCDLVIHSPNVSAIHAVLEVQGVGAKIYDMNSTNGTRINGQKIVTGPVSLGDKIQFGDVELVFGHYRQEDILPPVLDMLPPKGLPLPAEITAKSLPLPPVKPLPGAPKVADLAPKILYPLAQDPKAEFSEYIFEDVEILYPIFNYDTARSAVEVIILYDGRIFSVDYLPQKKGVYHLVGKGSSDSKIEYPYMGKTEKFPFIEISGSEIFVHRPLGYSVLALSDLDPLAHKQDKNNGPIHLGHHDIINFQKDKCQIFVRSTESPPRVASAPILRRDAVLKKLIFLAILFCAAFFAFIQTYEVDEEIEKEKVPERVATIIYKKELRQPPKPTPVPAEKKPEPTPAPKVELKKPVPQPTPAPVVKEQAKEQPKEQPKPAPVAEKAPPKKGEPPKAEKNSTEVAQKGKAGTSQPKPGASQGFQRPRFSQVESSNPGHVDTYKADSALSATVSSFLSKGGSKAGVKGNNSSVGGSDAIGAQGVEFGGAESKGLARAKVSSNIGSLTGAAQGKLVDSAGAQGLVDKKGVYTAGIPSETVVLGAMDPDIIRQILRDHIPQFRHCYQKELDKSNDEVAGVIELNFTIGASGHVTEAGVGQKSNLIPSVKGCVINVLRGIKFPEPLGGGTVEVKQPMNFYPVRS